MKQQSKMLYFWDAPELGKRLRPNELLISAPTDSHSNRKVHIPYCQCTNTKERPFPGAQCVAQRNISNPFAKIHRNHPNQKVGLYLDYQTIIDLEFSRLR